MSRVAKNPVVIPAKVEVSITNQEIAISGPLGKLSQALCGAVTVAREGDAITFIAANDSKHSQAMSGTVRALVANMVRGVSEGFERKLTLVGVGVNGEAVTQAIDISTSGGTRTVVTTNAYRSLTSVTTSSMTGIAGKVSVGLGLGLALPTATTTVTAFSVFGANVDKTNEAVGTVDATAYTVEPTTPANGTHNYTFNYKFTETPVSPAHNHTLA